MKKFLSILLCAVLTVPALAQVNPVQIKQRADGYHLGTAPNQQMGFNGATPTAQRSNANQAYAGAATGTLTFTGNPAAADTATIGSVTYTYKTALTGAANEILVGVTADNSLANTVAAIMAQSGIGSTYGLGTTANPSSFAIAGTTVAASSTLTSNNTNVTAADTVTIGTKVYTFQVTPAIEGDVLKGGSADASLLSLIRAINHSGTPGTDYVCAAANPFVSAATSVTSHAFAITALTAGASGNTIATTTVNAGPTLSFTGSTLANGTSAINLTATAAGTAGNSVATTETSSVLSFGASTLGSGTASASTTQLTILVNELRDSMVQKGLIKGSN